MSAQFFNYWLQTLNFNKFLNFGAIKNPTSNIPNPKFGSTDPTLSDQETARYPKDSVYCDALKRIYFEEPSATTNFDSELIIYFDWLPDGDNLAYSRGAVSSDVFLISDVI